MFNQNKSPQLHVIKISTDIYVSSNKELVFRKKVRQMRSLTDPKGFYLFEEELSNVGADIIEDIEGLVEAEDGLYELYVKRYSHDPESGMIDDVEYGLKKLEDD